MGFWDTVWAGAFGAVIGGIILLALDKFIKHPEKGKILSPIFQFILNIFYISYYSFLVFQFTLNLISYVTTNESWRLLISIGYLFVSVTIAYFLIQVRGSNNSLARYIGLDPDEALKTKIKYYLTLDSDDELKGQIKHYIAIDPDNEIKKHIKHYIEIDPDDKIEQQIEHYILIDPDKRLSREIKMAISRYDTEKILRETEELRNKKVDE